MTVMDQDQGKLSGKKVFLIACAFFGTIFAVNLTFVIFSLTTYNGVTVEKAYYKGRDYNQTLEQARAQKALGWEIKASIVDDGVAFAIEQQGEPVRGLEGTVDIKRPIDNAYDQQIALKQRPDGSYLAEGEMPLKGKWLVTLTTTSVDGVPVRQEFETYRK